jgi:hypothetical protein
MDSPRRLSNGTQVHCAASRGEQRQKHQEGALHHGSPGNDVLPPEWCRAPAVEKSKNHPFEKNRMTTEALTTPIVKADIQALQKGDRKGSAALFEPGAKLFDDGLDLIGAFHSGKWSDFQTCFTFHLSPAGEIKRLDPGQAE